MNARGAFAVDATSKDNAAALRAALTENALPGEVEGLSDEDFDRIVACVAETAAIRQPGEPALRIISSGLSVDGRRRMRLIAINDDMPFLVDSIAQAIAAHGLDVHRLLHPMVSVRRDGKGTLAAVLPLSSSGERRESIIYMEVERADARLRQTLRHAILRTLDDVRAAVDDWQALRGAIKADAESLPDGEGAALLRWFLENNFTFVGHQLEGRDGAVSKAQGIFRVDDSPLWSERERAAAFQWFADGREVPLILKSDRISTVHRRVQLDLVVIPVRSSGNITALSIHAGLWTSGALRTAPDKVPLLRGRLAQLEGKYGFDPNSHAGKALRHTLASLPHDLLIGFDGASLERLALNAMSLADRPRPKLMLMPDALKSHLFAFVWIPREEVSTARRRLVGDLLGAAARSPISCWSMELGDGDLALLRFTLDLGDKGNLPDEANLDKQIREMLRGWAPAVETALAEQLAPTRATRLALSWAAAFPPSYRERYFPREAARDILRLAALSSPDDRSARLYRAPNDRAETLRIKIYRCGLVMLSEVVPVLENFGFSALKEEPTKVSAHVDAQIYEFMVTVESGAVADRLLARAGQFERALADVLEGKAENDAVNQLMAVAELDTFELVLIRAWFRYMRQAGLTYGLQTVVDALKRAPAAARAIIALFRALHDPAARSEKAAAAAEGSFEKELAAVNAIDDDRILRWLRSLVKATLRTNAFSEAAKEALAFKIDSKLVPGLPAPVPWREIWVYSQRVEGIHLRGGPIARGGLRWSDRRDDFRTEILGLMKAQVVKNAVIVPTGAKGGFYPKQLPPPSNRDAWIAEGTESYRVFIRALLSITDNLTEGELVHPDGVMIRDDADPYFVVAADKGTASFSDVANGIAIDRGYWLGDAFASGGSQGYDHKAMGITARGAWISVQRHFAEMGVDVQTETVRVAGCGDMSGDVFGNGMLLSKALKLVAAFDHRHIFLDPDPDPAKSWQERARLFALPRSSWTDYDAKLISKGGGVFPRTQKAIPLSPEVKAMLDVQDDSLDPSALISVILKSSVDLLWFGGIGTYVKAQSEANSQVGDPANDALRVNGEELRAKAIGEGANLGITQAGRIAFAAANGRINTDFIDNSAGVDCSDNEVNIKIPLNREMIEGRLKPDDRNALLKEMTDDVAALVLEDNRLQTLALSLSERNAPAALPSHIRVIEMLEAQGRLNRAVEGLAANDVLNRRAQEGRGLTRPELAVLLSHAKLALQAAIERSDLAREPLLEPMLFAAFPLAMQERFGKAIREHRLRDEIVATKLANRIVNRLGMANLFELAEEEAVDLAQIAAAYVTIDHVLGVEAIWIAIEQAAVGEEGRLDLFLAAATAVRRHLADLLRATGGRISPSETGPTLQAGVAKLDKELSSLLRNEAKLASDAMRARLSATGADGELIGRITRLDELDGAIGNAILARATGMDELAATRAYVHLGEALGLDWARGAINRLSPVDGWERLLVAGLARDFEQLRLDFLGHMPAEDPVDKVDRWLNEHAADVAQFRALIQRAQAAPAPTAAMLAQIASMARALLAR
ncbi:MAG: NAD-glutamate dehydrogenase [Sphingomonadaceae bacterium]